MRIHKLSLGTEFFDDSTFETLKNKRLVSIHPHTKAKGQAKETQGNSFVEAKKGDLFYICRSNFSVDIIGMFSDERPLYSTIDGHEDWVCRSYDLLYEAKSPSSYDKELDKWWSPKNNSTFIQVPEQDLRDFELSILKPVFELSLEDLKSEQQEKLDSIKKSISDYASIQQKFSAFKNDRQQLFDSVNALEQTELLKLQYGYLERGDISSQPVVLLRKQLLDYLINGTTITEKLINDTKEEISSGFEKNVFLVWKDPFRILYTFLYDSLKDDLVDFFHEFIGKVQNELNLGNYTDFNLVHLDGAQNQGSDIIWFSIYNNTYATQKLAKQLHFVIRNGFEYGLYIEKTKSRDKLHKSDHFEYEHMIEVFKKYKPEILNDNSMEKAKIGSFIDILEHKKQIILQGPPGTGKTYTAKKIAHEIAGNESDDQVKIIQFHPSYTYEDFVRGITAKSEDGSIIYETENKLLAHFADEAMRNLEASNQDTEELSKTKKIKELLDQFSDKVQNEIDEHESYKITDTVSIWVVEEDAFRYRGNWETSQRMNFKDLLVAQLHGVSSRQELKNLPEVSGLARQHASYFIKVLDKFRKEFEKELREPVNNEVEQPDLKKYVLIVDEINRANLPSVLGELIYALEYRNEPVETMYALDGDNKITIPENMYIIGTMNTADRSVGHIDYAIKRRFAFADVSPNEEVIENREAKTLFRKVAQLFYKEENGKKVNSDFLSADFQFKDVQLGHSYFMLKEGEAKDQQKELKMRLKYEIIPILNEYVKDGLLLETASEKIEEIAKH